LRYFDLLFGLGFPWVYKTVFQLDSDQESTDGEDESALRGESLKCLTPDRLLFRAARVHNLPVMSQALAIGAKVMAELQVVELITFGDTY